MRQTDTNLNIYYTVRFACKYVVQLSDTSFCPIKSCKFSLIWSRLATRPIPWAVCHPKPRMTVLGQIKVQPAPVLVLTVINSRCLKKNIRAGQRYSKASFEIVSRPSSIRGQGTFQGRSGVFKFNIWADLLHLKCMVILYNSCFLSVKDWGSSKGNTVFLLENCLVCLSD